MSHWKRKAVCQSFLPALVPLTSTLCQCRSPKNRRDLTSTASSSVSKQQGQATLNWSTFTLCLEYLHFCTYISCSSARHATPLCEDTSVLTPSQQWPQEEAESSRSCQNPSFLKVQTAAEADKRCFSSVCVQCVQPKSKSEKSSSPTVGFSWSSWSF